MKKKNLVIIALIAVMFVALLTSCSPNTSGLTTLKQGEWAENNFIRLTQLITDYGVRSSNYDKDCHPYAVFDFDNTTIINDVQEALLAFQISNLRFKFTPANIEEILETGLPDVNAFLAETNLANQSITVKQLVSDIKADYTYLYDNYRGLNGDKDLTTIQATDEYKSFISKLRFLYEEVNATFDASVGYPWVTYLFTGMTSEEVRSLTVDSDDYWFGYPRYEKITWTTPETRKGLSGQVSVGYKTKLNITDEVKDLYATLQDNGIDVYICSASFIDVIIETATNQKYGLNAKEENIYAMRLKKDAQGRYINSFDTDYYQTQGEGKTKTIRKFIQPKYNGADPLLVGGDSAGDYNMMTDFQDMKLGLLFNRFCSDSTKELARSAVEHFGEDNARYILQGRDENTGKLRPSQASVLLGQDKEVLVR